MIFAVTNDCLVEMPADLDPASAYCAISFHRAVLGYANIDDKVNVFDKNTCDCNIVKRIEEIVSLNSFCIGIFDDSVIAVDQNVFRFFKNEDSFYNLLVYYKDKNICKIDGGKNNKVYLDFLLKNYKQYFRDALAKHILK